MQAFFGHLRAAGGDDKNPNLERSQRSFQHLAGRAEQRNVLGSSVKTGKGGSEAERRAEQRALIAAQEAEGKERRKRPRAPSPSSAGPAPPPPIKHVALVLRGPQPESELLSEDEVDPLC